MDDQNVVDKVVAVALGLVMVAALAWLGSPNPGTSRGNDRVRVSGPDVSGVLSASQRPGDPMRRCIDAAAARGVSACLAGSFARFVPPTRSDLRVQRLTHPDAVTPPPTQVPAPSVPASVPPATPQPSTPPAPTPLPLPHDGPVP